MKLLRFSLVFLLVCLLPSCGSDTPTTSNPPPPPPPTPSTPANVTASMTVVSATASTAYNIGSLEEVLRLTVETVYTNLGSEAALLGVAEYAMRMTNGAIRVRTRAGNITVPGSGQITIQDILLTTVAIDGNNNSIVAVDQRRPWAQSSDPSVIGELELPEISVKDDDLTKPGQDPCVPSATALCLNNDRFQVEVSWRDFQGNTGSGTAVPGPLDDEGNFWFFSADNWEMLVKVLDGCADNGHFWVFAAATTNVEHTFTVVDTSTGEFREYDSPLGTANPAVTDTQAFATCPAPVPVP